MWTVTVVSPLEYTGALARLMDGTATGRTPSPYQYSGRHIKYWKVLMVPVEKLAPGVTGKIQVGAVPGDSAQVSVPACAVPLACGTEPNAPDTELTDPLEVALLHAARLAAATTASTASAVARRGTPTGIPRDRVVPRLARVPGASFRAWAVCGRIIAAAFRCEPASLRRTCSVAEHPCWQAGASIIEQQYKV